MRLQNNTLRTETTVYYQDIFPVLLKYSQVSLSDMDLSENHEILLNPDKELSQYIFNELKKPKNKLALLNAIKNKVLIMEEIPKGATGKLQRIGLAEKLDLA